MSHDLSVGVAVITYNSAHHLSNSLPPLISSSLKPEVLVVDASSTDDTVKVAKTLGAKTYVLPKEEYNHGLTREKARKLLNTDIVVMMTPDAYAVDHQMIEKLVAPIAQGKVDVSYAKQLPHLGASVFEAFPRLFNYPEKSHIRSLKDVNIHGSYLYFCSNSCAAYRQSALDAVGGFPEVLLGEDTCALAKILNNGGKVAYVAEALVRHSHNYTLKQEFQRYFDTGLARSSYHHLLKETSSDAKRGRKFFAQFMGYLSKKQPHLIPYACLHTGAKWVGYRLGQKAHSFPSKVKCSLSSQKFYWSSVHYRKKCIRK